MVEAIWRQIMQALEGEIAEGRVGPGEKLPTEAQLSRRFGVNRHTVRRALAGMQADGLVHARRGAGVFVTHRPVPYRIGPDVKFSQNMAETGHAGKRHILRLETLPASKAEAAMLEIAARAPVHVLENVTTIDGAPAAWSHCVFPAERVPGLPDMLREDSSITTALARCGVGAYRRAWTRVGAGRADPVLARHLAMPAGAPVLKTVSLNRTAEGWPVEHAHTTFCADRIELVVDDRSLAPGAETGD